MSHKINHANIKEWAANYDGELFDGILCDPPYELGFMGKSWDSSGIAFDTDMWADLFKLVKPGGHLLAFSGSRTYHRMAVAIEDAGFEIRDMIEWVYGCLSEDTEILTESGYKFFKDISKDEKICIYNKDNNSYSYERPEKWSSYKVDNEDCYSIKSDDTDQIVSKNHRCLVERNGKLEFEFAENLREKEIVPLFEGNKVYNGDCLEVLAGIPDKSIDMVLTSPPYDNLRDYKGYTFNFEGIAKEIYRVLKDGGVCVWIVGDATIKGSETGTSFKQALYFKEIGFNLHDTMIYRKINYIPLTHNRYEQEFEYMFIFSKGKPKTFNPIMVECKTKGSKTNGRTFYQTNNQNKPTEGHKNDAVKEYKQKGNVWEIPTNAGTKGHPAQFPEKLAEDHMLSWSNEGDTILDPMAGSGTTLKMAKKNNRNYIGIEIAEEYCDLIHERTQDKPNTTLATIEKIKYTGTIFCPTVSTGAFIARRNGQVFITGNSGFPKSLNIGKAVDKIQGNEVASTYIPNDKNAVYGKNYGGGVTDNTPSNNEYNGYGTALKPAHEPCVLARKPLDKGMTVAGNVLKHGTGGLNIDGTRVGVESIQVNRHSGYNSNSLVESTKGKWKGESEQVTGRFPANLIHDGSDEVEAVFQHTKSPAPYIQQTKINGDVYELGSLNNKHGKLSTHHGDSGSASRYFYCAKSSRAERNAGLDGTVSIKVQLEICENNTTRQENLAQLQVVMDNSHLKATAESGIGTKSGTEWSMSLFGNQYTEKYPINIKSTTKTTTSSTTTSVILNWLIGLLTNESTLGVNLEMENGGSPASDVELSSTLTATISDQTALALGVNPALASKRLLISVSDGKNFHSTVKPLSLTKYLATLIKPPTGGRLLVPFSGSGSEMIGALQAGWEYVEGVELTEEYIPIAEARIKHWVSKPVQVTLDV